MAFINLGNVIRLLKSFVINLSIKISVGLICLRVLCFYVLCCNFELRYYEENISVKFYIS